MRLKGSLIYQIKQWSVFLILLVIVAFVLTNRGSPTADDDNSMSRSITIREIYNNGIRNFSQLDLHGPMNVQHNVGLPGLEESSCKDAFLGKAKNVKFKQDIPRWKVKQIKEDADEDCDNFISVYGLDRYPPPLQEELDFPLSFSLVFHQDFDQVLFLLRSVYHPQNIYCMHIDTKSPQDIFEAATAVAKCLPNVYLASERQNVVYAGYTRLKADLVCMKDALQSPVNWRYHLNMVGQQFPLKSNLEMVRILKLFNGTNDIEGIIGGGRLVNRFIKEFVPRQVKESGLYQMEGTGSTNPPPPNSIDIIKGSAFGTFSRAFVQYVISDPKVAEFIEWSKTVYSPDEYVWSTVHHSKAFKAPGGNNTGSPDRHHWFNTFANWGESRCYGKYIHGICILTPQDLPLLLSSHQFFANKFYITYHPGALHCLDKLIYSLTVSHTVTDLDFYKKVKSR